MDCTDCIRIHWVNDANCELLNLQSVGHTSVTVVPVKYDDRFFKFMYCTSSAIICIQALLQYKVKSGAAYLLWVVLTQSSSLMNISAKRNLEPHQYASIKMHTKPTKLLCVAVCFKWIMRVSQDFVIAGENTIVFPDFVRKRFTCYHVGYFCFVAVLCHTFHSWAQSIHP